MWVILQKGRSRLVATLGAKWLQILVATIVALLLITPVICLSIPRNTPENTAPDWSA